MRKFTREQLEFWKAIVLVLLPTLPLQDADATYLGTVRRYMATYAEHINPPPAGEMERIEKDLADWWRHALGVGEASTRGQFHILTTAVFLIADRAVMELEERRKA